MRAANRHPGQELRGDAPNVAPMALEAQRTLVKSPPELWGLLDDAQLMQRWCARVVGLEPLASIDVTLREAGERIAWRSRPPAPIAAIDVTLSEKGFGTQVTIVAACEGVPDAGVLDRMIDELAAPQRRPFARA